MVGCDNIELPHDQSADAFAVPCHEKKMTYRRMYHLLLAVSLLEIPLQFDAYFFYREEDAQFGALAGLNVSVMTFCLIGLYILRQIEPRQSREALAFTRRHVGVPLLLYLGTVAFSVVTAEQSMLAVFDLAMLLQGYLLYLFLANWIRSVSDVQFVMRVLTWSLAMQSTLVVATRVLGPGSVMERFRTAIGEDMRVSGTVGSPVTTGSFLALLLVPVATQLLTERSRRRKVWIFAVVTLATLGLLFTQTRGALLAAMIGMSVVGWYTWRRGWLPRTAVIGTLIVALVAIVPLSIVVKSRVAEGDDGSAVARLHHSRIALRVIADHPWIGVGSGNCHVVGQRYANQSPFRSEWYYTVHNKYLLVWVETGIVGMGAFVAYLASTIWSGWRGWQVRHRQLSPLALALAGSILGQSVHMAVDIFNQRPNSQMLMCIAGVTVGVATAARCARHVAAGNNAAGNNAAGNNAGRRRVAMNQHLPAGAAHVC
ncbi:MAG: O-antigen ligase family protein [Planctomycetales bacterium]|nr:O-antigen ligase family protein [Planctomycetales bacterium]